MRRQAARRLPDRTACRQQAPPARGVSRDIPYDLFMVPYSPIVMSGGLHISLAAERLFTLFGVPITNTLLAQWMVIAVLIVVALVVGRNPSLIPGKVQNFFELIFEFILNYME